MGEGLPGQILGPRFVLWLALFVLGGAAIYLGSVVCSGWAQVAEAFGRIGIWPLLLAAAVASLSYLIRFFRWYFILRWMGLKVPVGVNLGIYMSGLALTASPGKVGELVRSVLLAPFGVSARASLAAFLADRLSDVIGVCFLGASAGWINGTSTPYLSAALALLLAGSFAFRRVIQSPRIWARVDAFLTRHCRWFGRLGCDALVDWARVWSLSRVMLFCAVAGVAYGFQALVFAGLCHALGMTLPLLRAIEIFVSATLLGAATGLPGGLGAMEASLVVQLVSQGATSAMAVTAAIATRLATLWFGVLIGLGSLLSVVAHLKALARSAKPPAAPVHS